MKKNKYLTFPLFFMLLLIQGSSMNGQTASSGNKIWSEPFKLCWAYQPEIVFQTNIASDNELIFIPFLDGTIKAFQAKSGEVIWTTELGGKIKSIIVNGSSNIFVVNETQADNSEVVNSDIFEKTDIKNNNSLKANIHSIDISSGIVNWKISSTGVYLNSELYLSVGKLLTISADGFIRFINAENGGITNDLKTGKEISSVYAYDDRIILGTADKKFLEISVSAEKVLKVSNIREIPAKIFFAEANRVFWTDIRGNLTATNLESGKPLWSKKFGAGISGISDVSKGLLIGSLDNFIYFIDKTGGNILWKRRLAARVTEKPFIKDNISILSAFGDDTALLIELKKGKIVNSVSLSDANYFTDSPIFNNGYIIFPTLKGLYAFSVECQNK